MQRIITATLCAGIVGCLVADCDARIFRKYRSVVRHKARSCASCCNATSCTPDKGEPISASTPKLEEENVELTDEQIKIAESMLRYINEEREKRGLNVLVMHPGLTRFSYSHSVRMRERNRIFHSRRAIRENVAFGQVSSREVVRDWMRSRGHRATILMPNVNYFGGFGFFNSGWTMVVR